VLHRRDGTEHGQPVDAGLDVGGRAVLVGQHLAYPADL
jgi:hypothetical protein